MRLRPFLVSIALLGATAAGAESSATLPLSSLPDPEHLSALLWEHSPDLAVARARVAAAQADVTRAHLLPNPEADLSWNTLPIGPTNPPGLSRLKDVPNYNVGLSELIELGKRGPRQNAARAALTATALDTLAALRSRTYEVLDRAAEVAATEVRLAELEALAADAAKLSGLQRARQKHGDTAGLDVDRAMLEEEQLQTSLGEERAHLSDALLSCTRAAGLTCESFGGRDTAAAFLSARLSRAPAPADLDARPDLRSLTAQEQSARASLTLARRRWLPDPTVRAGYVRDQFLISGNQRDSLFVGLSVPLTFFDHGQADAAAASASLESARQSRELLRAQAERDVVSLTAQLQAVQERRARLRDQTLPLAEGVVKRLDAAVRAGGAALQDLLLARRSYGELLLRAADLDLTAFHLTVELDRARAAGPSAPSSLRDAISAPSQENPS
ncbi:TolC family protein [Hyalangium versicolor]|uniref:TolC family protein n=1 Tax=Hyalangium versicolor TaxID=2861190 RepID=UPI001CCE7B73|nr:TolC family protein [Hyalangium versicolor]